MCYNTPKRRWELSKRVAKILSAWLVIAGTIPVFGAFAATAPNPRGGATPAVSGGGSARTTDARRTTGVTNTSGANASRAATRRGSGIVRRVVRAVSTPAPQENSAAARVATTHARGATSGAVVIKPTTTTAARAASGKVARSATTTGARGVTAANVSRAATSRATAVFNNIDAIGGGYAACREAYATCMDQFCANANDTYRRCFCSSKFIEFRDTEQALDQAKEMLMQFEATSLDAVNKTAAEVNAMYSATVGEQAIKKDTSAAAKTLNEISDILAGKKKTAEPEKQAPAGLFTVDFTADMDDIWGGDASSSIFGGAPADSGPLEGQELYADANSQCLKVITESCNSDALLNMARSAYSIMITQDCNAYEKKITTQKENVAQTVRQAEKVLREARLEEYQAHNSADVNECISKIKGAIQGEVACGADYRKCLDYSGQFVNVTTGEAIYTPKLFQLSRQINLTGSADVLGANPQFDKFLESKRMFATGALDTCRDVADLAWSEFKRSALIEISQVQDELIEEVKSSCIDVMAECYNTQTDSLKQFDSTAAQYSGALAAQAASKMCQDKVATCAALYGGEDCKFNGNGQVSNASSCGLAELRNFVNAVDNVRVAEGCESALTKYLAETCTATTGMRTGYPWNCVSRTENQLNDMFNGRAATYCNNSGTNNDLVETTKTRVLDDLKAAIEEALWSACEDDPVRGRWKPKSDNTSGSDELETAFYTSVFGGNQYGTDYGWCVKNSLRYNCESINDGYDQELATYDSVRDECNLTPEWYKAQCDRIDGAWDGTMCWVKRSTP